MLKSIALHENSHFIYYDLRNSRSDILTISLTSTTGKVKRRERKNEIFTKKYQNPISSVPRLAILQRTYYNGQ